MANKITPADSCSDISISPGFLSVKEKLSKFSINSFCDPKQVDDYAELFDIKNLCQALEADRLNSSHNDLVRAVSAFEEKPYEPEYDDLCRLHYLCLTRKVVNTLEFGSGFSSAVMASAMRLLHGHFGDWATKNIRADQPFHVYAVEEEQRFLEITNNRLGASLSPFATISRSSVDVLLYDNRISTVYSKLPNISPDFIYLDGPSQFATTQEINGFNFGSQARMPMSADILRFEFFLEPGTLVLVDGRTANARFLKAYFRRNWAYQHDPVGDIHYFELQEDALGPFNKKKLEFCLDNKWLLT